MSVPINITKNENKNLNVISLILSKIKKKRLKIGKKF